VSCDRLGSAIIEKIDAERTRSDKLAGEMNYIIDGHNLIGKIDGLSLSMADDELRLIELLNRFSQGRKHKLEVYFDGAPPGQAGSRTYGRVRAHFVSSHQTADAAIRNRLSKLKRSAADWMVVSSDREVSGAARELHAQVMQSEDFAELMENSLEAKLAQTYDSGDQPLSEAEVDKWLAIFNARSPKK
jgi:predicted RNA-binding protein with PIN domain